MKKLYFFLLLCVPFVLNAQQKDSLSSQNFENDYFEQKIAESLEQQIQDADEDSDVDAEEYLQTLDEMREHPLNIHFVEDVRLVSILRFSEYQLYQLRRYIDLHGYIQTPQELASIDGFSATFVQSVQTYLHFGKPKEKEKMSWEQFCHGKSQVLFRYARAFNVRDISEDEGSADALLFKYTYRCADVFKLGFVLEKDAGESFFCLSNRQGFDYQSGYLSYKGKRFLKHFLLGDYQLQFGQGLAMGMGFQLSEASPDGIKNVAFGVKAHTSANEIQFLRGALATFALNKHWNADLFLSVKKIDASTENESCRSLKSSGYHRTISEIQAEQTLGQKTGGAYVFYQGNSLHIGSGTYFLHYDLPIEPESKPYNLFRFRGQNLWNVSTDFFWNYYKSQFFGETALSPQGNLAWTLGILHPANSRLQFSARIHHYPIGYHAISDVLKGSATLSNAQGIQCRIRLLANKMGIWDILWKADFFPWLKYQVDAPSQKTLYQLRYEVSPTKENKLLCSYRFKRSQLQQLNGNLRVLEEEQKHSFRAVWSWTPLADWQFRVQWNGVFYRFGGNTEKGVLCLQSCNYKREKLQLYVSLAFFNVDSYHAMIYISENDVLYAMKSSSFNGKGCRTNLVFAWKGQNAFTLQAKFGMTQLFDVQSSCKTEVKIQWIWKLQNKVKKSTLA